MPTKQLAEQAIASGKKDDKIGEVIRNARLKEIQKVKDKWEKEMNE